MSIKNFKEFKKINEGMSHNSCMSIADLIYVLEQKNPNHMIVDYNYKIQNSNRDGDNIFILDEIIELPSENMEMEMTGYTVKFSGSDYRFFTYNNVKDPNKLFGISFDDGSTERPSESNMPSNKTIGDLINDLKRIEDPENCLFFMRDFPVYLDGRKFKNSFASIRGLGNRNVSSYPFTKSGEVISGQLGVDINEPGFYQFMKHNSFKYQKS